MKGTNGYLFDADTFMTAHRIYYRFSFCPAYWQALLDHHEAGKLSSIIPVRNELLKGKDILRGWVKDDVPESFFHETTDVKVTQTYGTILKWVGSYPQLTQSLPAVPTAGWSPMQKCMDCLSAHIRSQARNRKQILNCLTLPNSSV